MYRCMSVSLERVSRHAGLGKPSADRSQVPACYLSAGRRRVGVRGALAPRQHVPPAIFFQEGARFYVFPLFFGDIAGRQHAHVSPLQHLMRVSDKLGILYRTVHDGTASR